MWRKNESAFLKLVIEILPRLKVSPILQKEGYAVTGKELSKSQKVRDILGGFKGLNAAAVRGSNAAAGAATSTKPQDTKWYVHMYVM